MKEELNQKISQFLDDELDHSELDDLLHFLKKEPELKEKMQRYQLANQLLKVEQGVQVDAGFSGRINQQLQQEVHHFLPKQNKANIKLWQKTSMAVAASVALVAVIFSQQATITSSSSTPAIAPMQISQNEQPIVVAKQEAKPSQHERLKAYLQAHNNDLYTHGKLDIRPMVRVASYGRD